MAGLRVLHRLFPHAGLVHAHAKYAVTPHHVVKQKVLFGKGRALAFDDLPRPQHIAYFFQNDDDEKVMTAAYVHAHITRAARVVFRKAGAVVFSGIDKIIRKPGGSLVKPLQLVFLRPGILIVQAARRASISRSSPSATA